MHRQLYPGRHPYDMVEQDSCRKARGGPGPVEHNEWPAAMNGMHERRTRSTGITATCHVPVA